MTTPASPPSLVTIPAPEPARSKYGDISTPFPVESLPGSVRDFVLAVSEMHGVEAQLPASVVIAGVSASLGRATELNAFRRRKAPPNLYLVVGAESGAAKTVISDLIMRPVTARLRQQAQRMLQRQDESIKTIPVTHTADTSDTALRKLCASSEFGTVAVITSDGRDLIENIIGKLSNGRFSGNAFIDGFSGDESSTARITRDNTYCERPCVTMSALPQVAKLSKLYECDETMTSGLGARILACIAAKIGGGTKEDLVTDSMLAGWESLLDDMAELYTYSGNPALLRLGGAAERAYDDFSAETQSLIKQETCELFQTVLRRQDEMAFRLSNIFHAIRWRRDARTQTVVCLEDYQSACDIVRWYLPQIASLTGLAAQSAAAALKQRVMKAYKYLEGKNLGRRITANDLRVTSGILESEVESLVAMFPAEFRLIDVHSGKRGRPAKFFEVLKVA